MPNSCVQPLLLLLLITIMNTSCQCLKFNCHRDNHLRCHRHHQCQTETCSCTWWTWTKHVISKKTMIYILYKCSTCVIISPTAAATGGPDSSFNRCNRLKSVESSGDVSMVGIFVDTIRHNLTPCMGHDATQWHHHVTRCDTMTPCMYVCDLMDATQWHHACDPMDATQWHHACLYVTWCDTMTPCM
jgi:hypothetical protein